MLSTFHDISDKFKYVWQHRKDKRQYGRHMLNMNGKNDKAIIGSTCLGEKQEGHKRLNMYGKKSVARWPKFWPKNSKGAGEKLSRPEEFVAKSLPNFT